MAITSTVVLSGTNEVQRLYEDTANEMSTLLRSKDLSLIEDNYERLINRFKEASELGSAPAAYMVGMYYQGQLSSRAPDVTAKPHSKFVFHLYSIFAAYSRNLRKNKAT